MKPGKVSFDVKSNAHIVSFQAEFFFQVAVPFTVCPEGVKYHKLFIPVIVYPIGITPWVQEIVLPIIPDLAAADIF